MTRKSQHWLKVSGKSADAKTALPTDIQYVLDGGALLHRIPWNKGSTFSEIFKTYSDYVLNKYGEAIVVFDGYEVASTKDLTHMRRSKGKSGPIVSIEWH